MDLVHLHTHTNMSMLDALQSVDELFDRVKELGHKAVAISDHGVLSSFHDAYKAYKRTGVKFLPACEMYFVHSYDSFRGEKNRKRTERRKHIVLIAQNNTGYRNLLKLNYLGFKHYVVSMGKVFPRISWDILEDLSEGIIATSACGGGILAEFLIKDDYEKAIENAKRLANIFDDRFYIEIQPHNFKRDNLDQIWLNNQLIKIARELDLPLVVGSDAHYLKREHAKIHDILLAIGSKKSITDPSRHSYGIDEYYVKDVNEVFSFLKEHHGEEVATEAVENTSKIADRCENPDYMEPSGNHLPIFNCKEERDYDEFLRWQNKKGFSGLDEDKAFMRFRIVKGFKKKFRNMNKEERKIRWDRVKKELKVLEGNGFSSYMLITSDYIRWAKENGILVGCGRGSVGNSIIAYLLNIHTIDPIEYDLVFERFQNAEKKDLPDIDTDFTSEGRDRVIQYVREKYGEDNCAHVSNLNKYTPKSVIPDLIKTLRDTIPGLVPPGKHYVSVSDHIKSLIPEENKEGKPVKTLKEAISLSPKLRQFLESEPELQKYSDFLIGLPKTFSVHAGGLIIADKKIYEYAPVRVDKDGTSAVQYEKERCEKEGLIKMDFLAISNLDIIDETFKNIRKLGLKNTPTQMEDIPLNDKETYKMIQNGHTKCVFQLGKSSIMSVLCKKLKPKNILDIAMVNALGRPSAKEIRDTFINRRNGVEEIKYPHSSLKRALSKTYGLAVTEEQLLLLSSSVSGFTLNKADGLRKLTKLKGKNPKLAEQLEQDFIDGAIKTHQMEKTLAKYIWDHYVSAFGGYGFNLSHAIFYSINGYITAYLKRHYPSAFMAAYLKVKTERGGISKDDEIEVAKKECKRLGLEIIPPDINNSKVGYEVLDNKRIIMGFYAIKGMGGKAIENVVKNQPYVDMKDFLHRTDARTVNKTKIEVLTKAGCFDSFGLTRQSIFMRAVSERARLKTNLRKKEKDGYDTDLALDEFECNIIGKEWDKKELLMYEKQVLGELISGNIDDLYPNFFIRQDNYSLSSLRSLPSGSSIMLECIVKSLSREIRLKSGKNRGKVMGKYNIEDLFGNSSELTVWPDDYSKIKEVFVDGIPIKIVGTINEYNGSKSVILNKVQSIYRE